MAPRRSNALLLALAVALWSGLEACTSLEKTSTQPPSSQARSSRSNTVDELMPMIRGMEGEDRLSDLRYKVYLLADYACGVVGEAVGNLLIDDDLSPKQRVWLQRVRLDIGRSMIATASNPDPVTDLFQQLFLIRVGRIIVEREAPEVLGQYADPLIAAFKELDHAAWVGTAKAIGRSLDPLNEDVEVWVKRNPTTERFWWSREMGLLRSMGSTDTSHYSGLFAAVDRANDGIDRLNLSMGRTAFLLERLPMLASWEMQLGVSVVLAQADVQAFANGPNALAKSIATLDQSISAEFGTLAKGIEGVQHELGDTSTQLRDSTLALGKSIDHTSQSLNNSVEQLQQTLESQSAVLSSSVSNSSKEIDQGTHELSNSLVGLADTIVEERKKLLDVVSSSSAELQTEGRAIINGLAWRIGFGVGIVVVITIVLSVIGVRLVSRFSSASPRAQ